MDIFTRGSDEDYCVLDQDTDITSIYIFSEIFDPKRLYTNSVFIYNFGQGDRTYKWVYHQIGSKFYVAAKEIPSITELDELRDVCQCSICLAKWFDICNKLKDPNTVGCLKGQNHSQLVLNKTRVYHHDTQFI